MNLSEIIEELTHELPSQGPIANFIHHNTLHALQQHNFFDALKIAQQKFGVLPLMKKKFFLSKFEQGQISEATLKRVLDREIPNAKDQEGMRSSMFSLEQSKDSATAQTPLHNILSDMIGDDLPSLVNAQLIKWVSLYLDQGISLWQMPDANSLSFYACVLNLQNHSVFKQRPFNKLIIQKYLGVNSLDCLQECISYLQLPDKYVRQYLKESLLSLSGWFGLTNGLEQHPKDIPFPRAISLNDVLAIKILLETSWLKKILGTTFRFGPIWKKIVIKENSTNAEFEQLRLWQLALEEEFYNQTMQKILTTNNFVVKSPEVQAIFCIDDRECSLRRHLEQIYPKVETYGAPGHFGVDFFYQGSNDFLPLKHCPVPVNPKHLIKESHSNEGTKAPYLHPRLRHSLLLGWLSSYVHGVFSGFKMAHDIFMPGINGHKKTIVSVTPVAQLKLERESDQHSQDGLYLGFSPQEMAQKLAGLLNMISLSEHFASLVVLMAHGSTSVNNPYFSAYDCGACCGKHGSPNSRAFAMMANRQDVRTILEQEHGISIPKETFFVGAFHDTCKDRATFFLEDDVPSEIKILLDKFQDKMSQALKLNAVERSRLFDEYDHDIKPDLASLEMIKRSYSIFEPRPELGHATNALCIVAPRESTRAISFNRRAFLQSYVPEKDATGKTLLQILSAVIPVCGGINLEYYFSRVNNPHFGAGTKLPHNIVSLLGVACGMEGDLLTGLPIQMVDIHDPVRLLLVVEQKPEIVAQVIDNSPSLKEWVDNDWVKIIVYAPDKSQAWIRHQGRFEPYSNKKEKIA